MSLLGMICITKERRVDKSAWFLASWEFCHHGWMQYRIWFFWGERRFLIDLACDEFRVILFRMPDFFLWWKCWMAFSASSGVSASFFSRWAAGDETLFRHVRSFSWDLALILFLLFENSFSSRLLLRFSLARKTGSLISFSLPFSRCLENLSSFIFSWRLRSSFPKNF